MILRRLRLENFRQHIDTDLHFDLGMTAIVGPNGSGKSTLVEAIGFALYGEQRDKKETLRFHWGKGKRYAVTLEFEFDGRRFQVERTHSDAHLVQIGEKEIVRAHGLTETTRACERLLHLGYDQFVNSFCAEQKQLAFLQFRTNAARQEEVARMLGFDRLRLAEDLAIQRRREAAIQREALDRLRVPADLLATQQMEARAAFTASKRTLDAALREIERLERESEIAAAQRQSAEKWLGLSRDLVGLEGELDGLREIHDVSARALQTAEAESAELREVAEGARLYRVAEEELATLAPLRIAAAQGADLRRQAAGLCEELAAIPDHDFETIQAELLATEAERDRLRSAWETDREQAVAAVAAATARYEALVAAVDHAARCAATGLCPECGQPVADSGERLTRARAEADASGAALDVLRRRHEEIIREPNELVTLEHAAAAGRERLDEASRALNRRSSLEELRQQIEERLRSLPDPKALSEIDRLERTLLDQRPAFERWLTLADAPKRLQERTREHRAALQAIEGVEVRRRKLLAERDRIAFENTEQAMQAIVHHQTVSEETAKIRAERSHSEARLSLAERDLAAVEARLSEQRGLDAEVDVLRRREALYEVCAREMRTLRQELNASIGPELSSRASENLGLLTNGRYLALELDRNFGAAVVEDGVSKPVISGGEEDVVALSLRLALSELIQERQGRPMSLLILDEVFASLDAERRQSVLDRLTALKGRFEQIVVITHIEEVQQVADQTIHLVRDSATRGTMVVESTSP